MGEKIRTRGKAGCKRILIYGGLSACLKKTQSRKKAVENHGDYATLSEPPKQIWRSPAGQVGKKGLSRVQKPSSGERTVWGGVIVIRQSNAHSREEKRERERGLNAIRKDRGAEIDFN